MRRTILAFGILALALGSNVQAQSPIQIARLDRLATHLDTKVQPKNFDIGKWGSGQNPDDPSYIGCAGGHATALFKDEGFRYAQTGTSVKYKNLQDMEATKEFFGVSNEDNTFLFTMAGRAGTDPKKAAANIRKVIEKVRAEQAAADLKFQQAVADSFEKPAVVAQRE